MVNAAQRWYKSEADHHPPLTLLDYAKIMYGGEFTDRIVDDVKTLRCVLVVHIFLIPYRLINNQASSIPLTSVFL